MVGVFDNKWSTNISMALAFKKKDHEVTCFDYRFKRKKRKLIYQDRIPENEANKLYSLNKHPKNMNIKIIFRDYYKKIIIIIESKNIHFFKKITNFNRYYLFGNWKKNRQLLNEVKKNKYDLTFLIKINTINYKIIPKLNKFTKTWYFFMDPLETALDINAHKYASLSTWSNATFSSVNSLFRKFGANSYYITQGINPNIFNTGNKENMKERDVIFIGSESPKRRKFVNFLKENKINIKCFGQGWKNKPIYLKELVDKYRASKIILNFTRGNIGFSIRVFQVLGTGSFLISEYCQDLPIFFKKGIHLEWFRTSEELLELINFYLKNDKIREKVARQGYEYVQKNFIWEKIMEKIIQIINNKKEKKRK